MTTNEKFDTLVTYETKRLERALVALAIPHYMRQGVVNYVIDGIKPGGFLTAVLENDLMQAWRAADGVNRQRLNSWAELVTMHVPAGARGSKSAIARWVKIGGWKGHMAKQMEQQNDDDK